ncbi:MAG: hypothetical protein P8M68_01750 [Aquiluna sp.]|nr:hypothetical protein [Aquiluna sp.]
MKIKKLTALLASVLTIVALSGCSLSRDVASLDPYAPSDGVLMDIGDLKARNFLLIKGTGSEALLIGSIVNSGLEAMTAGIQILDEAGSRTTYQFEIAAKEKLDLGYGGNDGIILTIPERPGSMHMIYFTDGLNPVELMVPVLDGQLEEYRPFAESLN